MCMHDFLNSRLLQVKYTTGTRRYVSGVLNKSILLLENSETVETKTRVNPTLPILYRAGERCYCPISL